MQSKTFTKILYENGNSQQLNPFAFSTSPTQVYLAGLGAGSRRTMGQALARCAGLLIEAEMPEAVGLETDRNGNPLADPASYLWHQLDRSEVASLRAALIERYAPATANKMMAALRGVLREAWRLGLLDAEQLARLTDLKSAPGNSLPAGRALTAAEIRALFEACAADDRPQGVRDAALLGLLLGCGLRRAEMVALDASDYATETGELTIRIAKRGKQRTAYAPLGTQAALRDWLGLRGQAEGPLFWPINRGGAMTPARLSEQAIYEMLWRRAGQSQVSHLSPHDCRRTFISNLLDGGVDIATVQKMAGHSNVATTTRYDRRSEAVKQKAAWTLHIPYLR